jgi:NAD+ synthase (glutamine-hydrolysing)
MFLKTKFKDLSVSIHQINTVTGDLRGNTAKIIKAILIDQERDITISAFPETAITGYMCGSLWDTPKFLKDQMDCLETIKKSCLPYQIVTLGFISYHGKKRNGYPKLKNSVAIIHAEKIFVYDKQLLADADHHEDKKYFIAGNESKVFEVTIGSAMGLKIGCPICEDIWYKDHSRNIAQEMVEQGANILIVPNQSYFYYDKQEYRYDLLSSISSNTNVPVIYVNSVGVGDIVKNILIFDGGSLAYNNEGRLIREAERFKEQSIKVKPFSDSPIKPKVTEKYEEITDALLFEQKEFFHLCGLNKAQVHLSGGVDSALTAVLVAKAMGKENTIFITNPSELNTESIKYAEYTANKLGVKLWVNPIVDIVSKLIDVDKESFKESNLKLEGAGLASAHAVLRTVQGLMASHRFGSGIVSTGNHTENILSWFSFHDIGSIGVHALIGDLTKMEIFAMCVYLNKRFGDVIPEELLNGIFVPSAELPDSKEDPFDYKVQSGICAEVIRFRKSKEDLMYEFENKILSVDLFPHQEHVYSYSKDEFMKQINLTFKLMKRSPYKTGQAAPPVNISPRTRGFSTRETLINKYDY